MSLPKFPSASEVREFLEDTPREDDEPEERYIRRALKAIILANGQTRVANRMGINVGSVARTCEASRVTLDKVCRLAEAVRCRVIVVPVFESSAESAAETMGATPERSPD